MASSTQSLFSSMDISISAMRAERTRMDVVMSNLANAESTRTREGGPYKRRTVTFQAELTDAYQAGFRGNGVKVAAIEQDNSPPIRVFRPGHPDADADGFVSFPDIRTAEEMVDLMTASRSYEANAEAFKISKALFQRALDMGRG
ncbi:MAG: flagellar basal body rod protein FlgC [Planctomycetota bacterium]|nr:flagellar basal body rod protein FlgC [Planctomycetota bacterium]